LFGGWWGGFGNFRAVKAGKKCAGVGRLNFIKKKSSFWINPHEKWKTKTKSSHLQNRNEATRKKKEKNLTNRPFMSSKEKEGKG